MRMWLVGFLCATVLLGAAIAAEETLPSKPTMASPSISIEPLKLDFSPLAVGSSSQPMIVTLANAGSNAVKIVDITASGIDFTATNTCGDAIAGGSTCQVQVTFKPATTGNRLGVLSLMLSSPNKPYYVPLTGVGQ